MRFSLERQFISLFILTVAAAFTASALAQDAGLPGGANTLNETHNAWTVTCVITARGNGEQAKRCALSQTQLHGQTRQRALTIELHPEGDGVRGTLVLPFGLALRQGVTYQLDNGEIGVPESFRTCLPAGCLIDIDFDAGIVASLKAGNTLNVNAIADGGEAIAFSVSLAGFSNAYARVVELTK